MGGKRLNRLLINNLLLFSVICVLFSGCSVNSAEESSNDPPYSIRILLPSFHEDLPDRNSPIIQAIERYTNTELDIMFAPDSVYDDTLKVTFASKQNMPAVIVIPDKTPSFIQAAKSGLLWEVGPYLNQFPNLSQADAKVLENISIDGKIYGVYRARDKSRVGISYRKDWLDNLGLEKPQTIEDFYEMLHAFTYNDPDGNGKDDTYGMVVSKFPGTFDVIQTWFGVPNQWDEQDGKLIPAHETPEYKESLDFLRKLYEEGLINPDFAIMNPANWLDPIVNGEAGVIVDFARHAARIQNRMGVAGVMDVIGSVEGPDGIRLPSSSGHHGMISISKSAVPTEEELLTVLDFLDKLNDAEIQNLVHNGIEYRHYLLVEDYVEPLGIEGTNQEKNSLNQMMMYIPHERFIPRTPAPLLTKADRIIKENEKYLVHNPAEPYISEVYVRNGYELDRIIANARTAYILGKIDEQGWEAAMKQWEESGGWEVKQEINLLYRKKRVDKD